MVYREKEMGMMSVRSGGGMDGVMGWCENEVEVGRGEGERRGE